MIDAGLVVEPPRADCAAVATQIAGHVSAKLSVVRRAGRRPDLRTLDLFSGCGGITTGFHAAGFRSIGAVELDEYAAATFTANFLGEDGDPEAFAPQRNILDTDPEELVSILSGKSGKSVIPGRQVDVLVGGPPCQAFARVGRAKLREVAGDPDAYRNDERVQLYQRYLAFVKELAPIALLMENVPDILNHGGFDVANEICQQLESWGYECQYTVLNSVFYGVPQMRERMFLVAVHKKCRKHFNFPKPSHCCDLPSGYAGSLAVACKVASGHRNQDELSDHHDEKTWFVDPAKYRPPAGGGQLPAVTIRQAIGDLPAIKALPMLKNGKLRRKPYRPTSDHSKPYRVGRPSEYARAMRNWPGMPSRSSIEDHLIRCLPTHSWIFAHLNPDMDYPAIKPLAVKLAKKRARRAGYKEGTAAWENFLDVSVPRYDESKFPNKWWVMDPEKPSRTLMAHLSKDCYSHIHYDSKQARTISIREAARLQSFPDGFVFKGTMNPIFRQIGNAVPPLMALALAKALRKIIR